jgi:hypothetical protein
MCAQQIFFDGSAKKQTFATAFERAVGVYCNKASTSGFLNDIEHWVERWDDQSNSRNVHYGDDPDFSKKPLTYKKTADIPENAIQEVADMIKKYRPRE